MEYISSEKFLFEVGYDGCHGKDGNKSVLLSYFVYVIAWARGQLRINFTRIFKVFTKLPESRSDEGNLENFENASEINP